MRNLPVFEEVPEVLEIVYTPPTCCHSCGNTTSFTYLGTQTWPPRVAERLNIPTKSALWRCDACHTTITKT